MKNTKNTRNIRVIAENSENMSGFDIYLDFSGHREYLESHRHNGMLYKLLENGVSLDEMRRWKPGKSYKRVAYDCGSKVVIRIQNAVDHIVKVADSYISDRCA